MSSLARRIQVRAFRKGNVDKVPVLHRAGAKVLGFLWPRRRGQLAYTHDGVGLYVGSKHPLLQPLIDILEANHLRATT